MLLTANVLTSWKLALTSSGLKIGQPCWPWCVLNVMSLPFREVPPNQSLGTGNLVFARFPHLPDQVNVDVPWPQPGMPCQLKSPSRLYKKSKLEPRGSGPCSRCPTADKTTRRFRDISAILTELNIDGLREEAMGITTGATTSELFSEPDKLEMDGADKEALQAHAGGGAIHRHRVLEQRPRIEPKTEAQIRSRDGDESNRYDAGSTGPTKTNDIKDLLPALERCEDLISKHEEITGSPMNEATKKATVSEMAPAGLAAHLKLDADRCSTYLQMEWQVVSYVNLKLPSHTRNLWTDHDDDDPEDWNIDHFGKTAKVREQGMGKGRRGRRQGKVQMNMLLVRRDV